jgi:hypothetical protein
VPVQGLVDLLDERDRLAGRNLEGLHTDPKGVPPQPGGSQPLRVLSRPDSGFDADPGLDQGSHLLGRTRLGQVDRRVVGRPPCPDEPYAALNSRLDPGAGRDADWDLASVADPPHDVVHNLGI